jgi:hypothetical protein
VKHPAGKKPGDNTDHVEIVNGLYLETGVEERGAEPGPGITAEMLECAVERPEYRRASGDQQKQRAAGCQDVVRRLQKLIVVLDMLENVDGDDGIRLERVGQIFQIPVIYRNARVASESLSKYRQVISGWLDQSERTGRRAVQNQFRYRSNSRAGLNASFPNMTREGIDDPIVIVRCLGHRVELGAGI